MFDDPENTELDLATLCEDDTDYEIRLALLVSEIEDSFDIIEIRSVDDEATSEFATAL